MARGKPVLTETNGVIGKNCKKCLQWQPLDNYYANKKAFDGRRNICKECDKENTKQYRKNNEEKYKKYTKEYNARNKESKSRYNKKYREKNKEAISERTKRWRLSNKEHISAYARMYRVQNPEQIKMQIDRWTKLNREVWHLYRRRRKARVKQLPDDLTIIEQKLMIDYFGGCALTGDDDFHYDHVIPISIGHGGTTMKNIIPLRPDLNMSKHDKNIFEWFEANRQRFNLSQKRFDHVIVWLGKANDMSVVEYRNYVYWCHANPKVVDIEGG